MQRHLAVFAAFAVADDQVALAGGGADVAESRATVSPPLVPAYSSVKASARSRAGGSFDGAQPPGEFAS